MIYLVFWIFDDDKTETDQVVSGDGDCERLSWDIVFGKKGMVYLEFMKSFIMTKPERTKL